MTGYGVIESDGKSSHYIAHGCIRVGEHKQPERLALIHTQLTEVIQQWSPQEAAIEEVFVSRNASSALKLGQARGVALAACVLSRLTVSEYAARLIKQSVVGTGAASKTQVQHMAKALLNIRGELPADAADALAVALCHAHSRLSRFKVSSLAGRGRSRRKNLRSLG